MSKLFYFRLIFYNIFLFYCELHSSDLSIKNDEQFYLGLKSILHKKLSLTTVERLQGTSEYYLADLEYLTQRFVGRNKK